MQVEVAVAQPCFFRVWHLQSCLLLPPVFAPRML
jgi:hypothetical protein